MATTLLGALVERFDRSSLVSTVSGGLYVAEYPENTNIPFVVLVHQGEVPECTFEKAYTESGAVQFHCFAQGLAAAESIASGVKDLYDWCVLDITGARNVSVRRVNYLVTLEQLKSATGDLVFDARVDYRTELARTLPFGAGANQ